MTTQAEYVTEIKIINLVISHVKNNHKDRRLHRQLTASYSFNICKHMDC